MRPPFFLFSQVFPTTDEAVEAMLAQTTEPSGPSLFSRLCWCQCSPVVREAVPLEAAPDVMLLSGVSLQDGSHITAGSLQTLRWGKWDGATRTVSTNVFGGFFAKGDAGKWTQPAVKCTLYILMFLARTASFQYVITFSEDFQSAVIKIRSNCLCCLPCLPPWFTFPDCCTTQTMIQSDDSIKGDHWLRMSGCCGAEPTFFYNLFVVYDSSGTPTRFADRVPAESPAQLMMTF